MTDDPGYSRPRSVQGGVVGPLPSGIAGRPDLARLRREAELCRTHHGCPCREYANALVNEYGGMLAVVDNAVSMGLALHLATRTTCAEHIERGDDKAPMPHASGVGGIDG